MTINIITIEKGLKGVLTLVLLKAIINGEDNNYPGTFCILWLSPFLPDSILIIAQDVKWKWNKIMGHFYRLKCTSLSQLQCSYKQKCTKRTKRYRKSRSAVTRWHIYQVLTSWYETITFSFFLLHHSWTTWCIIHIVLTCHIYLTKYQQMVNILRFVCTWRLYEFTTAQLSLWSWSYEQDFQLIKKVKIVKSIKMTSDTLHCQIILADVFCQKYHWIQFS